MHDHNAVDVGAGHGHALRARLFPELIAAADAAGITIALSTSVPSLATAYRAELPGLTDTGPALLGSRRHRRLPARANTHPQEGTRSHD